MLGRAINKANGDKGSSSKPLRAPLLIAVVASYRKSDKVPRWEQEAVASGVAHVLSLLLDEAGWGVFWRTGDYTRSKAVAKAHGLGKDEELLGWLYVGGKPPRARLGTAQGASMRAHHVVADAARDVAARKRRQESSASASAARLRRHGTAATATAASATTTIANSCTKPGADRRARARR